MADNTTLNTMSGGDVIRSEDRGGVKTQAVILDLNTGGAEALIDGRIPVAGDLAHDAAETGNPILNGAQAVAHLANPTAVAAGDRTKAYANRAGIPFVIAGHPNVKSLRATYTAAQTNIDLIAAAGAGLVIVVTQIQVTVSNATTATPSVLIGFHATTTPTAADVVAAHPGMVGGGGFTRGDGSGILAIGPANTPLKITLSVPTGGAVDVVVSYYTVET